MIELRQLISCNRFNRHNSININDCYQSTTFKNFRILYFVLLVFKVSWLFILCLLAVWTYFFDICLASMKLYIIYDSVPLYSFAFKLSEKDEIPIC